MVKKITSSFFLIILIPSVSCAKIITLSVWNYVLAGTLAIGMMNYYPTVPPKPVYAPPNYTITLDHNAKGQWGSYWAVSADGTITNNNGYAWTELEYQVSVYDSQDKTKLLAQDSFIRKNIPAGYKMNWEVGGGDSHCEWIIWDKSAEPTWLECNITSIKDPNYYAEEESDGSSVRDAGRFVLGMTAVVFIVDMIGTYQEAKEAELHSKLPIKFTAECKRDVIGIKATRYF